MDGTESIQPERKQRAITTERVLLFLILVAQLAILTHDVVVVRRERASTRERLARIENGLSTTENRLSQERAAPASAGGRSGELRGRPSFLVFPSPPVMPVFEQMDRMVAETMDDFSRMETLMNFDRGWDALTLSPAMDMHEDGDHYVVLFSLPGVNGADISASLKGRILTVQGITHGDDRGRGRRMGRFERRVQLPGPVGAATLAQAVLTNGVLKVTVPKTNDSVPSGEQVKLL